jgi:hypothetical protein
LLLLHNSPLLSLLTSYPLKLPPARGCPPWSNSL